jgi:N-hydroxyarylamine O-acetyltransferase
MRKESIHTTPKFQMDIANYLARIGFDGDTSPTIDCLTELQRCHALSVPYENVDIQLSRMLDFDLERIFHKIVVLGRGGWCFELHLLFSWALRKLGFDVSVVAAGIERAEFGDTMLGNHSILLVDLGETYLVDLGLGDGPREPIPFHEGTFSQCHFKFKLEKLPDGYWRFHNHEWAIPENYDFDPYRPDADKLTKQCHELQTDPESVFVQNLVCQIMEPDQIICLTGRILRTKSQFGTKKSLVLQAQFENLMVDVFGIVDQEIAGLWPDITKRHNAVFGDRKVEDIEFDDF